MVLRVSCAKRASQQNSTFSAGAMVAGRGWLPLRCVLCRSTVHESMSCGSLSMGHGFALHERTALALGTIEPGTIEEASSRPERRFAPTVHVRRITQLEARESVAGGCGHPLSRSLESTAGTAPRLPFSDPTPPSRPAMPGLAQLSGPTYTVRREPTRRN